MRVLAAILVCAFCFAVTVPQPVLADQNRKVMKLGQKALKLQYKIEKKGMTERLKRKAGHLQQKAVKLGVIEQQ